MTMAMTELMGEEPEVVLAERRYAAIAKILETVVKKREEKRSFTDILDHVFLHRVLEIPIFLALLYVVFQFTFSFSAPFSDMIDLFFGWLGSLTELHIANPMLASFVSGGICAGLGSVLVFIPPIFMLFFALAILEDSGYLEPI